MSAPNTRYLLTTRDIAARFGVARRTVAEKWAKRPDFPPPARRVSVRSVWWWADEVEAWATPAERLGQEPPAQAPAP